MDTARSQAKAGLCYQRDGANHIPERLKDGSVDGALCLRQTMLSPQPR